MGVGEKILSIINEVNEYSFKLIEIPKNHYLLNHGELEENIYFVVDGALKLVYIDENEEHTLRFGYKNSIITSLQSLLKREPSQCYIQSIRKTKLYCIPINIFNSAKEQSHELQVLYNSLIKDVVVQQLEREIDILTNSPQDRYQRVLKRSPTLFQEIPALHIAAYLRMTPETLSRIRKS